MGFGLKNFAAVAGSLLVASFLLSVKVCSKHPNLLLQPFYSPTTLPNLQILHTSSLEEYQIFSSEIQDLKAQLASQTEQCAVLQRQLNQLEPAINVTEKRTTHANGVDQALRLSLSSAASSHHQHKLAVLVPYRDRQEHLAQLVSRLQNFLTVRERNISCTCIFSNPLCSHTHAPVTLDQSKPSRRCKAATSPSSSSSKAQSFCSIVGLS